MPLYMSLSHASLRCFQQPCLTGGTPSTMLSAMGQQANPCPGWRTCATLDLEVAHVRHLCLAYSSSEPPLPGRWFICNTSAWAVAHVRHL